VSDDVTRPDQRAATVRCAAALRAGDGAPGPSPARRTALGALAAAAVAAVPRRARAAAPGAGAAGGRGVERGVATAAGADAVTGTEWPDDLPAEPAGGRAADTSSVGPVEWPPLQLVDGRTLAPDSWHGLAAVLVVWSVRCPFCVRHNPRIEALHRASAGRPLRVLGASIDTDVESVRRHMREHRLTFPVTLEAEALRARFGLRRVTPTTVTFDRGGRLLQRIPGEMSGDDVRALLRLADTR
jgi:hypothetical protein